MGLASAIPQTTALDDTAIGEAIMVNLFVSIIATSIVFFASTIPCRAESRPNQQPVTNSEAEASNEQPENNQRINQASQDEEFLALVKIRDSQLVSENELRRIAEYPTGFTLRLRDAYDIKDPFPRTHDSLIKVIDSELARLKSFEANVKTENDVLQVRRAAQDFDVSYPLLRSDILPSDQGGLITEPLPRRLLIAGIPRFQVQATSNELYKFSLFSKNERQKIADLTQSISSGEIRGILNRYENVLKEIEHYAVVLNQPPILKPLDELPQQFNLLASDSEKVDYDALTVAQIQSGIDKYRAALTKARDEVPDEISSDLITSARKNIDTDVDHITAELANQTNDERELRKRLEDQIVASAKSVYGKAVGSDSFNYLLIVFTLVFGVVMVLPRFYPEAVAANILKAEFYYNSLQCLY